eukprot:TRINITY_DN30838_c0_g1_i1.p1 TRINITY_DN30838_c0_g1~~TRINITY_DN30838_c0_g1_i1.p1  ORF type:complete len:300 (-),score=52.48 TRINITY_DN30838_c0_g1_i1:30-929(-)
MASLSDRCHGLLLGLAAGDRNGGPIQMALTLGEQLAQDGAYNPVAVFEAYTHWWQNGDGVDAWDTGPMAQNLFAAHLQCREEVSIESLEERAQMLDKELRGMTAGVNAVHRVAPLAIAGFIPNGTALAVAARQESRLTHWSDISQHSCAVTTALCRHLLNGLTWTSAIDEVVAAEDMLTPGTPLIVAKLMEGCRGEAPNKVSGRGGFCPEVLKTSAYFISSGDGSFDKSLENALKFAGQDNYCPVMVGCFLGCALGASAIPDRMLTHCKPGVRERCACVAEALSASLIERSDKATDRCS